METYAVYHKIESAGTYRIKAGLTAKEAHAMADLLDATSVASSRYFAERYDGPIYWTVDDRYSAEHVQTTARELRDIAVRVFGDTEMTFEERADGIYDSDGVMVAETANS